MWFHHHYSLPCLLSPGPRVEVKFKMSQFFSHDKKTEGDTDVWVTASHDPDLIDIRPGSSVSEWVLIEDLFQDTLRSDSPTPIKWTEGTSIYCR